MFSSGNSGSLPVSFTENPRSPSCAATRLACPRCPPALSTFTSTPPGGIGATGSSAPEGSTSPAGGLGIGQDVALDAPPALTSTTLHVKIASAASTPTTTSRGPRLRRW
jgi:hypothetical protein